jgi:DnaA family protein
MRLILRWILNAVALLAVAYMMPSIHVASFGSALLAALVLGLASLADEEKILALQLRAQNRGMALEPEVARFILQRSARGMSTLIETLDRLDSATLEAGRRISIPFVKAFSVEKS